MPKALTQSQTSALLQQQWDHYKNIIRYQYVAKAIPLQGDDGLIKFMEHRYQFKATKSRYEKQLKQWGFRKKRVKEDWQIIGQKIKEREQLRKKSAIYKDGHLISAKELGKEICRQGYLTFAEELEMQQAGLPQTPPGFSVVTPSSTQPPFHLVLDRLPLFQFQSRSQEYAQAIQPFNSTPTSLTQFLGKPANDVMSFIDAILPDSTLRDEINASDMMMSNIQNTGNIEFLNLTAFMVSNNLTGEDRGWNFYQWLKSSGSISAIDILLSMNEPTAHALVESLFRLAVEDNDVSTVKSLLQAGVNPNGNTCLSRRVSRVVSPLQHALIEDNAALAQELIRAGSKTDEPGAGWKSNAIVLAIVGRCGWGGSLYGYKCTTHDKKAESGIVVDNSSSGDTVDTLIDLVECLINAGASIYRETSRFQAPTMTDAETYDPKVSKSNMSDMESDISDMEFDISDTEFDISDTESDISDTEENGNCPREFSDYHSPLTAASKYRQYELVKILLAKGADVNFLTSYGASALLECICSYEALNLYDGQDDTIPRGLSIWSRRFSRSKNTGKVNNTVNVLISAGSNVNAPLWYCSCRDRGCNGYRGCGGYCGTKKTFSSLHLAVYHGDYDLMQTLIWTGANVTFNTVKAAFDIATPDIINLVWTYWSSALQVSRAHRRLLIMVCCRSGNMTGLSFLLDEHFDSFRSPAYLDSSIQVAIDNRHEEMIDPLIAAGAAVNAVSDWGRTALIAAVCWRRSDLAQKLVDAGALLVTGYVCESCETSHLCTGSVLVAAIQFNCHNIVQSCLTTNYDLNAPGRTSDDGNEVSHCLIPLTAAIRGKRWDLVDTLLQRNVSVDNPPELRSDQSPMAAALSEGNVNLAKQFVEIGALIEVGGTLESSLKHLPFLEFLLETMKSRSLDLLDFEDVHLALESAILSSNWDATKLILNSKLIETKKLGSALFDLFRCADERFLEILQVFFDIGAEPNGLVLQPVDRLDQYRLCTLQTAIYYLADPLETTQTLLEMGANPDGPNGRALQSTPLQETIERLQRPHGLGVARLLLNYKANPNAIATECQHTPLQLAAREGQKDMVELLLEYGADVNAPAAKKRGATALQFASIGGYLKVAHLLLEHGAEVNAPPADYDGRTALEGVAEHGRIDMVQFLLNAGAYTFGEGKESYERAVKRASKNGHFATRRLLEDYHAQFHD